MGANAENQSLMEALEALEALKLRGITAACGPNGSVVVDRWQHVRGVWHYHAGNYFWIAAGSSEPSFRADSEEKAVAYTLDVISRI